MHDRNENLLTSCFIFVRFKLELSRLRLAGQRESLARLRAEREVLLVSPYHSSS